MSRLVAFRFQVDFSLVQLDDDEPVNEFPQAPVVLYGLGMARDWLDSLPQLIADAELRLLATNREEASNGSDPDIRSAVP
ncbi:MAG TPA: hypothetical protein VH482_37930 [Thermomicrobiales bacterium]|jgi:hypothetical protein